jgi:GNAT superfamily N-acetyltransferase
MMESYEIRWANENDCHRLGCIHANAYRSTYQGIMPDEFLDSINADVLEQYYHDLLYAAIEKIALIFVDQEAIGCMVIRRGDNSAVDELFGEFKSIYLLKRHWGNGLGKKLILWGIDRIKEWGCTKAFLWVLKENINAIRFYENLKFETDGEERLITRGENFVQVRYQKILINSDLYYERIRVL